MVHFVDGKFQATSFDEFSKENRVGIYQYPPISDKHREKIFERANKFLQAIQSTPENPESFAVYCWTKDFSDITIVESDFENGQ